jgi:uncharacterized membrane protein
MKLLHKKILLSILCITVFDFIFLSIMSKSFSNSILEIQKSPLQIRYIPMIICYILMIFGYNYFITLPNKSVLDSFLFGFVVYGIFDTTTMTIFNKWSWKTAVIDTIWGSILFGTTTLIIKNIL